MSPLPPHERRRRWRAVQARAERQPSDAHGRTPGRCMPCNLFRRLVLFTMVMVLHQLVLLLARATSPEALEQIERQGETARRRRRAERGADAPRMASGAGPDRVRTEAPRAGARARPSGLSDSDPDGPRSGSGRNASDADREIPSGENPGTEDALDRLIEEIGPSADAGTRRVIESWLCQGGCQGDVERIRHELRDRRSAIANRAGYATVSIKNAVLERRGTKPPPTPRPPNLQGDDRDEVRAMIREGLGL